MAAEPQSTAAPRVRVALEQAASGEADTVEAHLLAAEDARPAARLRR